VFYLPYFWGRARAQFTECVAEKQPENVELWVMRLGSQSTAETFDMNSEKQEVRPTGNLQK